MIVRSEALRRGGFQLSTRFDSGEQAGTLEGPADRTAVTESEGIAYLHHIAEGTQPRAPGEIRWRIRWIAPSNASAGPVIVNVAANAANDDRSEFGDLIVSRSDTVKAAPGR